MTKDFINIARRMKPIARIKFKNGGTDDPEVNPLQSTFESENVPTAQVSPKPGKNYGQLGGKTINQDRINNLSRSALDILNHPNARNFIKNHFGIDNYTVTPVTGTWENEPEPSFTINSKNMTPVKAKRLAAALGMGMWQDAAVHLTHHPALDLEGGTPTVLLGHGGVLSPEERQNILSAAADKNRDLTFTKDGKAAKFSHFGSPEEHNKFVDDIEAIRQASKMPQALMVRTNGDLTDAKNYKKTFMGQSGARTGVERSTDKPSDLFRGLVDHILTPFQRAAEREGYRFSLQKFADHHKLSDQERNYLFSKATAPERRPPSGVGYNRPTVRDPVGYEYPGIYGNPKDLATEAASRVAPESPNLKRLFGVTRADLYAIGQNRVGNMEPSLAMASNPKGSSAAQKIMTPENEQRLIDILDEAGKHQRLRHGMDAWYVMDPLFHVMKNHFGLDEAKRRYTLLNTLMGMASPGSEVPTEINRGTAAYYLHNQGRFPEFVEHAGKSEERRGEDFPSDIRDVMGHPYHSTSQAGPMQRFLERGEVEMGTPKVPTYIPASGVPETGFQTRHAVPDAHYTRIIGMGDTRTSSEPGVSMKMPEYQQVNPWWRERVASRAGLEAVPAQARIWGAGSGATGVSSPIGAPKLEMLADHIVERARVHGITPERMLYELLEGKRYASGGEVKSSSPDHPAHRIPGVHIVTADAGEPVFSGRL